MIYILKLTLILIIIISCEISHQDVPSGVYCIFQSCLYFPPLYDYSQHIGLSEAGQNYLYFEKTSYFPPLC